jgi:hypothetical protein
MICRLYGVKFVECFYRHDTYLITNVGLCHFNLLPNFSRNRFAKRS